VDATPRIQIGELSHRVGVSRALLRTWERRYGLLRPVRMPNGFRLYSELDEWRVRVMQEQLWSGVSAGEAARAVRTAERERQGGAGSPDVAERIGRFTDSLQGALEAFDEERVHASLDRLFAGLGVELAIRNVLLPYLRELGERWARAEIGVGEEHFASRLLEARLLSLARGWNKGPGPRAVLACPPNEHHTLPLIGFGLALRGHGWRNIYLGADTPPSAIHQAASTVDATLIVLPAVNPKRFDAVAGDLRALARTRRLIIAGAGATPAVAAHIGVDTVRQDPITAAAALSNTLAG
jgi:MerR family transcriptional regulator, light-induced transcriptional regulator